LERKSPSNWPGNKLTPSTKGMSSFRSTD
jgi:hypothetical protein